MRINYSVFMYILQTIFILCRIHVVRHCLVLSGSITILKVYLECGVYLIYINIYLFIIYLVCTIYMCIDRWEVYSVYSMHCMYTFYILWILYISCIRCTFKNKCFHKCSVNMLYIVRTT